MIYKCKNLKTKIMNYYNEITNFVKKKHEQFCSKKNEYILPYIHIPFNGIISNINIYMVN